VGRTQLAINIPAPLLERLRAAAAERGVTYSSMVLQWIEAGLGADLDASRSDLAARLAAIEQRLVALERGRLASPTRVIPALRLVEEIPNRLLPATPPAIGCVGPITTAELAELLAVRRGTLNARISRAGGAAVGLELNGWRCVALEVPSRGGPARALWEPVE
jgi:DNA-binding XRE family transcriptional regulator